MATNRSKLAQGAATGPSASGGARRGGGGPQAVANRTSSGGGSRAYGNVPVSSNPTDSTSRGKSAGAGKLLGNLGGSGNSGR